MQINFRKMTPEKTGYHKEKGNSESCGDFGVSAYHRAGYNLIVDAYH